MIAALTLFRKHRKILTILLALAVAAAFYVQWQVAALERANNATAAARLVAFSDRLCAALGVTPPAQDAPADARGDFAGRCQAEAGRLGQIEGDLAAGSLDVALAAMERQHGKQQADAALAAAMSKRTADAVEQMEAANAAVQDDRVGAGWAAAVNDLGGLRR